MFAQTVTVTVRRAESLRARQAVLTRVAGTEEEALTGPGCPRRPAPPACGDYRHDDRRPAQRHPSLATASHDRSSSGSPVNYAGTTAKGWRTSSAPSAWPSTQWCSSTASTSTPPSNSWPPTAPGRRRTRRTVPPTPVRPHKLPRPLRLHQPPSTRSAPSTRSSAGRRGRRRIASERPAATEGGPEETPLTSEPLCRGGPPSEHLAPGVLHLPEHSFPSLLCEPVRTLQAPGEPSRVREPRQLPRSRRSALIYRRGRSPERHTVLLAPCRSYNEESALSFSPCSSFRLALRG